MISLLLRASLSVFLVMVQAQPFIPAPSTPPMATNASELRLQGGIMASRAGDARLYVLLGSGFIRAFVAPELADFAGRWLAAHPTAVVKPISHLLFTNTRTHQQQEIVYVWIEDGTVSLNVDLVAAGMVAGGAMHDMVDNQRGLDELMKNPPMADARAEIAKERAAAPQDRTDRLIAEDDYSSRLRRVAEAEHRARLSKSGIWSDTMKEEREAEGIR